MSSSVHRSPEGSITVVKDTEEQMWSYLNSVWRRHGCEPFYDVLGMTRPPQEPTGQIIKGRAKNGMPTFRRVRSREDLVIPDRYRW